MNITGLDRQHNGAYLFDAIPGRMDVTLSYLSPVVRDAYQVIGADGVLGNDYLFYLVYGETREVFVFYYFNP